jgi:hypothetical protein
MCGRYRRTTSEKELARLYHIAIPQIHPPVIFPSPKNDDPSLWKPVQEERTFCGFGGALLSAA